MRILLTGKDGQLGWELQRALQPLGEVIAVGRTECDLARPAQVREVVRHAKPELIVNAAAYTAVDKAESEPASARAINADAPGLLAEEARRLGAALIHYSTDYVFDGSKATPYVETDATNPLSVYGRTKLAGEQAVAAANVPHLILRTSWVYAARGHNFLLTMMRLAREGRELRVVDDQYGVPNWAGELAAAVTVILTRALRRRGGVRAALERDGGTFHLSAPGRTTWHGFAVAIIAAASARGLVPPVVVQPITTGEYPTPTRRPANSVLSGARLAQEWSVQMPSWEIALDRCLAQMRA